MLPGLVEICKLSSLSRMITWAARKELVRRADTTTTRSTFLSSGNSNVFSAGFERSSRIHVPNTSRDSTSFFYGPLERLLSGPLTSLWHGLEGSLMVSRCKTSSTSMPKDYLSPELTSPQPYSAAFSEETPAANCQKSIGIQQVSSMVR